MAKMNMKELHKVLCFITNLADACQVINGLIMSCDLIHHASQLRLFGGLANDCKSSYDDSYISGSSMFSLNTVSDDDGGKIVVDDGVVYEAEMNGDKNKN
ncbi:unnamed protein product [Cunninghamella blakesleeana]